MSGDDKRREARYKAHVPVKVIRNKEIVSLVTEDVSFRGVFLKMEVPPALRQLVRLEVSLPEGSTLKVHAMVVYRIAPGTDAVAGAGMQFYGLEGRERAQWDGYVQTVRDALPKSVREPGPLEAIDERREFERFAVRFEVRVSTMDELLSLYTRDISKGGMAVETDMDLAPGTDVGLDLIHPKTSGTFELEAVVRRKIRQATGNGLAVEFKEMTPDRRAALEKFIAFTEGPRPRA